MLNLVEDPRANHLRQMAEYFHAELDEGDESSTITMDNNQAKGFISSYQLFPGLIVWVYNITFYADFKVELALSENRPYYFSYNVTGNFLHRFQDEEEFSDILQNQHMIFIGSPNAGLEITFPAHIKLEIAVVVIDNNLLGSLDAKNAKKIHLNVQKMFQFVDKYHPFKHLVNIDTKTKEYASIVCNNKDTDLIGSLRTEGAILNMLASQIQAYSQDTNTINTNQVLQKNELSRITSVEDYVLKNLDQKFTISSLSKKFDISPKKLQSGIKFLSGDTVAHYLMNLRMGEAKNLLNTTDLSCSEVSYRVGIFNLSYFSKMFKLRYDISPSQIRSSKAKNLISRELNSSA